MKKYSLVLEGGGAKGAYQVGGIKALQELGYEFDAIVGTSIGAINAAFICQGDMEKLNELWKTLSFQDLMDINNEIAEGIMNVNLSIEVLAEASKKLIQTLKSKGIDINRIRNILETYIDEDKIRKSNIRFGLVTYCLTDMTPRRLFIEDIPKGELVDYLLATSNLPVFKRQKIADKSFVDGGTYDNCSVEMLYDSGYTDIVAIRIFKRRNRIRHYGKLIKKKELNLKIITPSEELPSILNFGTKNLNSMLEYGYIDTLKQLKNLDGERYAMQKISASEMEKIKKIFTPRFSIDIAHQINLTYKVGENIVDVVMNRGIKKISDNLSGIKTKSFKKQIICIIEALAQKLGVSKNNIYSLNELVDIIKEKFNENKATNMEKVAFCIVKNM